ncbi:unnamed protein product [Ranitomeya imitator]|uniref:Hexosyltransferase n=1 Tax=Ranitomeya imitator TaxID=111125 RepID=A0ABN9KT34_9NEOB|nr:unnamed protein product [Ranitomeya imitator]
MAVTSRRSFSHSIFGTGPPPAAPRRSGRQRCLVTTVRSGADGSGSAVTLLSEPRKRTIHPQEISEQGSGARSSRFTSTMQVSLCRLRTHQCCFILIVLFHALLFGADLMEEYLLRSAPITYKDGKFMVLQDQAQRLNLSLQSENISRSYAISSSRRCMDRNVFLLVVIFSFPENRMRRERLRQTWGKATSLRGLRVTRIFMLGRPQMQATEYSILNESHLHQDLVQGTFLDPSNDTLKAVMMMEWVVTFCSDARFILKADDYVFVNVESLSNYLLSLEVRTSDVYTGRVIHQARPDRDPHSLSFVPLTSYSKTFYPDYCSGSAMVISRGGH